MVMVRARARRSGSRRATATYNGGEQGCIGRNCPHKNPFNSKGNITGNRKKGCKTGKGVDRGSNRERATTTATTPTATTATTRGSRTWRIGAVEVCASWTLLRRIG